MMVVMTSLTFSFTFSHAGISAQRPPASIAPSRQIGMAITAGTPVSAAPSSAEAIAPK